MLQFITTGKRVKNIFLKLLLYRLTRFYSSIAYTNRKPALWAVFKSVTCSNSLFALCNVGIIDTNLTNQTNMIQLINMPSFCDS